MGELGNGYSRLPHTQPSHQTTMHHSCIGKWLVGVSFCTQRSGMGRVIRTRCEWCNQDVDPLNLRPLCRLSLWSRVLIHASACPGRLCIYKSCIRMKQLLAHVRTCKVSNPKYSPNLSEEWQQWLTCYNFDFRCPEVCLYWGNQTSVSLEITWRHIFPWTWLKTISIWVLS